VKSEKITNFNVFGRVGRPGRHRLCQRPTSSVIFSSRDAESRIFIWRGQVEE